MCVLENHTILYAECSIFGLIIHVLPSGMLIAAYTKDFSNATSELLRVKKKKSGKFSDVHLKKYSCYI